jgi:hypothetical protein
MNREKLGRRAITCKNWRWTDGALDGGFYCERYSEDNLGFPVYDTVDVGSSGVESTVDFEKPNDQCWPDFEDNPTKGALLGLVRQAWGDSYAWLEATNRYYAFEDNGSTCCEPAWLLHVLDQGAQTYRKIPGMTEAEALLCALEMAP